VKQFLSLNIKSIILSILNLVLIPHWHCAEHKIIITLIQSLHLLACDSTKKTALMTQELNARGGGGGKDSNN